MKLAIGFALLVSAVCVQAKEGCGMELEGGMRITKNALEFTEGDKTRYKILNDQTLVVNDRSITLDAKQQLLVKQYSQGVRAIVPDVQHLALDGVDLAAHAMDLVFTELLGPDNKTAQGVQHEFSLMKADLERRIASEAPININQKGIQTSDFLGADFERRINKIVESSQKEITWNVVKELSTTLFSSDEKDGSFETRMNKFGEKMDRFGKSMDKEMNARATNLEQRVNQICASVSALDAKEEELKQSIQEISSVNIIKVKNEQQIVNRQ